jgi:triosephosphate isomerase
VIAQKMVNALSAGLTPILCIGERERDVHGTHLTDLERQVRTSLSGVSRARAKKVIVAYEPIWAIGKSAKDAITLHELHEMSIFIKKILTRLYGRGVGMGIRILYGGSVEGANIEELCTEESIDGFLVGHASLSPEEFTDIVRHA